MKVESEEDLALITLQLVNDFWEYHLGELELYHYMKQLKSNNGDLMYDGEDFNQRIIDIVGRSRLDLVDKLIQGH